MFHFTVSMFHCIRFLFSMSVPLKIQAYTSYYESWNLLFDTYLALKLCVCVYTPPPHNPPSRIITYTETTLNGIGIALYVKLAVSSTQNTFEWHRNSVREIK